MTMLPDHADFVIGVDTHKDTHTAVVVAASGAVLSNLTFGARIRIEFCRPTTLPAQAHRKG
jgi:hypothetical protein